MLGSSRNTSPRTAATILRPTSSAYSSSCSAPTKKRPSSFATTPVVADPQKGSKTRSPPCSVPGWLALEDAGFLGGVVAVERLPLWHGGDGPHGGELG